MLKIERVNRTVNQKMKKEFKAKIQTAFSYSFKIEEDGLYTLTIRASCKPGWRNKWWLRFKSIIEDILDLHLDDDDLRVEIDGRVFSKPKAKRGLFNSPAAFSGTKTLGKTKTVVFILYLSKGSHTLKFIPDGSPYLENLEMEKVTNPQKIIFYLNLQAEDENYYSWYTFALVSQPLKTVSIVAQAGILEGEKDDDDLKILFDGEVQKNPKNLHRESYFCGFTSQGKVGTFSLDPNLIKAIIYRESRLGYYPDEKIVDVMQVWNEKDLARPTLLGEKPESEFVSHDEIAFIHEKGVDLEGNVLWEE